MFGGVGTVWGPVIGSVILIPLAETLNAEAGSRFPGIQGVIYGLAIISVILLAPEGMFWKVRDLLRKRSAAPIAASTGAPGAPGPCHRLRRTSVPLRPKRSAGDRRRRSRGAQPVAIVRRIEGRVEDVSFDCGRNEILGIIGPNGAGKTTLFNVLNGFLRPDTGQHRVRRHARWSACKPHELCRHGVGRTFQVVRAFPRMSVSDNVVVGAYVARQDRCGRERLAADGACTRRAVRRSADAHRRRAHHQGAAADGARPRAGRTAAASVARRDARRPRPRRARRRSWR